MAAERNLGWRVLAIAASLIVALELALLAVFGAGEAGLRVTLRATAACSLLFFLAAYAASSSYHLWPGKGTAWLIHHRRYLGLTFAVSHTIHLWAIAELYPMMRPDEGGLVALSFGGLGYALMYAMAATSFDGAVARLGVRRWKQLHTFGLHYLWSIFAFTYSGVAAQGRWTGILGLTLLFAGLGARVVARRRAAAPEPATG